LRAGGLPFGFVFSEDQTPRSLSAHDPLVRGSIQASAVSACWASR
jgi:hypothetical protein